MLLKSNCLHTPCSVSLAVSTFIITEPAAIMCTGHNPSPDKLHNCCSADPWSLWPILQTRRRWSSCCHALQTPFTDLLRELWRKVSQLLPRHHALFHAPSFLKFFCVNVFTCLHYLLLHFMHEQINFYCSEKRTLKCNSWWDELFSSPFLMS